MKRGKGETNNESNGLAVPVGGIDEDDDRK